MLISKRNNYAGLYIHFPYCIQKCSYCDFYSVGIGHSNIEQRYLLDAYKKELLFRIEVEPSILDLRFDTLFIGGGTPSLLDIKELSSFLQWVYKTLPFTTDPEISIEMNPENVTKELLDKYHSFGFNRINVGVQSFQPILLQTLDRYYSPYNYENLIDILDTSNINNYGIDLIYGIPGQTEDMFFQDMELTLSSNIKHISLYSLTLEENTKYHKQVTHGIKKEPVEELQIEILKELPSYLSEHGFRHYEVSNYSKPGYESKHNLKYWTMETYLGIGPSAHGFTSLGRYENIRNVELYKKGDIGSKYQPTNYLEDLAVSLFRIFLPIYIDSFIQDEPNKQQELYQLFYKWRDMDICTFEDKVFQWKETSILHLDDYIYEIYNIGTKNRHL